MDHADMCDMLGFITVLGQEEQTGNFVGWLYGMRNCILHICIARDRDRTHLPAPLFEYQTRSHDGCFGHLAWALQKIEQQFVNQITLGFYFTIEADLEIPFLAVIR
jgi:hypothetical protein